MSKSESEWRPLHRTLLFGKDRPPSSSSNFVKTFFDSPPSFLSLFFFFYTSSVLLFSCSRPAPPSLSSQGAETGAVSVCFFVWLCSSRCSENAPESLALFPSTHRYNNKECLQPSTHPQPTPLAINRLDPLRAQLEKSALRARRPLWRAQSRRSSLVVPPCATFDRPVRSLPLSGAPTRVTESYNFPHHHDLSLVGMHGCLTRARKVKRTNDHQSQSKGDNKQNWCRRLWSA